MNQITCGRCTKYRGEAVKHDTVTTVRACYAAAVCFIEQEDDDQARAEIAAEARNERFWENRGADDGFDDWEARRGVIDFSTAMALAEGR